jgi:hypothetical protein
VVDNKSIQRQVLRGEVGSLIKAYLDDPALRRAVWADVMADLPAEGDVIVIGHSLGSVVAADILPRLQPEVHVPLMLTIGSPLGLDLFTQRRRLTYADSYPIDRIGTWLNLYDTSDLVTLGIGVSRGRGPALDVPISTGRAREGRGKAGIAEHDAAAYLSHRLAARAIGLNLHDQQIQNPSPVGEPSSRVDAVDALMPLVWRLAWSQARAGQCRIDRDHVRGDRVERVLDTLSTRWSAELRSKLPELASEGVVAGPLAHLRRSWPRGELVTWLTLLSLDHPEAPYYCGDPGDSARDAIRRTLWKAAVGSSKGAQEASRAIGQAIDAARHAISTTPNSLDRTVAALAALPALQPDPAATSSTAETATRVMSGFVRGGQPGGLTVLARLCGLPRHGEQWGEPVKVREILIDYTADMEPSAFRGMLTGLLATSIALNKLHLHDPTDALAFCEILHDRCVHDLQLHARRDTDSGSALKFARARATAAKRAVVALEKVGVDP